MKAPVVLRRRSTPKEARLLDESWAAASRITLATCPLTYRTSLALQSASGSNDGLAWPLVFLTYYHIFGITINLWQQ